MTIKTETAQRGRPKAIEKRAHRIGINVTDSQREELNALAAASDMPVSVYVVNAALDPTFRFTPGELKKMRAAATLCGLPFDEYVRKRLIPELD